MALTGVHILLTYSCTFECDHCFVWGSPRQKGVLTLSQIDDILGQAREIQSVRTIYFEGGEPFLYAPVLYRAVARARDLGFAVCIVSNAYWATAVEDARVWLEPLAGSIESLSVSRDAFHGADDQADCARTAASSLDIPIGQISVVDPQEARRHNSGQLPSNTEVAVMFRGRAAATLAPLAPGHPWPSFSSCEHENLDEPERVHVDPLGHVQLCQGLSIGNLFERPLAAIWAEYRPHDHPIIGPLLEGGPAALIRTYDLQPPAHCADACHLCDHARRELRERFPDELAPDQVYGSLEHPG